jgi:hypothetical protein
MELLDAIQELSMQDNNGKDSEWLSPEYAEILREQETIRKQFKNRERSLEYLSGVVTDLFVDWHRIHGNDCRHKIVELQNMLLGSEYSFDTLVQMHMSTPQGRRPNSHK